jgi:hypothetical protein
MPPELEDEELLEELDELDELDELELVELDELEDDEVDELDEEELLDEPSVVPPQPTKAAAATKNIERISPPPALAEVN